MIVARLEPKSESEGTGTAELRVVTQPDHARLAGDLMALWRADGLPEHPRRSELLFAVREHDNGWREADSAPRADPETGRPFDFRSYPDAERIEVWRRGIDRYAEERPWAARLIAQHPLALHADERGEERHAGLFAMLDAATAELDERLEAEGWGTPEELAAALAHDYPFLALGDTLSLVFAMGGGTVDERGYRAEITAEAIRLDPFPLAGSTRFRLPCRTIPDRRYASDGNLAVELATARWGEVEVRVERAG